MKVFSDNEWSPLKSVIVGNTFNFDKTSQEIDLSFKLFFGDNDLFYYGKDSFNKTIANKRYVDELTEDVENFVDVLKQNDITVYRPKQLDNVSPVKTPYWKSSVIPALNVRDQVIILGDTIVETSPLIRGRYFENDLMKHIFYNAFMDGANYVSMPKPMMTDDSFDKSYYGDKEVGESTISKFDIGFEMMIDAAQFVRFGKDIIVNVSNQNHKIGVEWFKRNFPEYRFHEIFSLCDNHLDSYVVPLCEGTLLVRDSRFAEVIPDFLEDWEILYCPEPYEELFPKYDTQDIRITGKYIDMNVLCLGDKRVVTNSLFPELNEMLYQKGFDVIPVRHRHRRIFGGGWHCFTLDLERT